MFLILAGLLILFVLRFLWKRYRQTWEDAKEGAVILRHPRRYVTRVLSVQIASYIARIGVNANFMFAFGIPVTIRDIFLHHRRQLDLVDVRRTPGGVGTQQAMASFALRDVGSGRRP